MNRYTTVIKPLSIILLIFLTFFSVFAEDEPFISDEDPRFPVGAKVLGAVFDRPYTVRGITYHRMRFVKQFTQKGIASWYGKEDHGKKTSSGEKYNMFDFTAAHKQLPIGSLVRVDCKETGKSVVVRINDRGPHVPGRVVDLSYAAASALELIGKGLTKVDLTLINGTEEIPEEGLFSVQIASYASKETADLVSSGIEGSKVETATVNGKEYHRVKVYGFISREEAEMYKNEMSVAYPNSLILTQ